MTDLIDIWLKLPSPDPVMLDRIGVSFRASQKIGGVRKTHIRFGKRRLDALVPQTDAGGAPALIIPVFTDPPSLWRNIDDPALIDLVAFDPVRPNHWQTACGEGVMLGEAAYQEAMFDDLPLPVFKDPLRWLQSGGAGMFPLDPDRFAREVVGHPFLELVGEDLEHGVALARLIESTPRCDLPEVRVAA